MMRFRPAALAALLLCAFAAQAQAPAGGTPAVASESPTPTALDAALFYQLLLGELNARGDEPTLGYSLILDAARTIDLAGDLLTPGFVDLHCHGGGGHSGEDGAAAVAGRPA